MIPLPTTVKNELDLVDWLELRAICAADKNTSLGDLERTLTRAPEFDNDREGLENKLADVSKELEFRRMATDVGYPFNESEGVVTFTGEASTSTYVFCLLLSYVGWKPQPGVFPARMFESLSAEAARIFLSSVHASAQSVRFGAPRKNPEMPTGFRKAVDKLCKALIREGGGWSPSRTPAAEQDGGLDVVAWRDWRDQLPGKLVLFGACATGDDYTDKTHDIMPREFCDTYMGQTPPSAILKAFFLPHRIGGPEWTDLTRAAGIVFDRCRIALLVKDMPPQAQQHGDPGQWVSGMIEQLAA